MPLMPQIPKPQVVKPKISEEVAETEEDVQVSEEESRQSLRTLPKTIREYMILMRKLRDKNLFFLQIK